MTKKKEKKKKMQAFKLAHLKYSLLHFQFINE